MNIQRVLWASREHSSYASAEFLKVVTQTFKYKIECAKRCQKGRGILAHIKIFLS
jgi:hypothetical protein